MTETETEADVEARRQQNRRFFRMMMALVLGGPGIALYVLFNHLTQHHSSLSSIRWPGWLALGIIAISLPTAAGVVVWMRRRGARRFQPVSAARIDRGRRIGDAIRQCRPVEAGDQAAAVEMARRMVFQRWISYALLGSTTLALATSFLGHQAFRLPQILVIIGAVGVLVSGPFTLRDVRRARRWLRGHENDAQS